MKTVIHLFYNPSENGVVEYGFIDSPFGRCLAAFNYSGLCSFEYVDSEERAAAVLRRVWADSWVGRNRAFDRISFEGLLYDGKNPLPLCFRGTTFQSAVWQALLRIAPGETMTYAEVAAAVGCPGAVRQVALAIAANRLAVAVPCHRVVCDDGGGGGYRWGRERKKAIVDWERMAM